MKKFIFGLLFSLTLFGVEEKATFGGGCFWCVEAVFQKVNGVKSVVSGYSGGRISNPSYKMISTGLTGHAEVIQIVFDNSKISYGDLLEIFWKTHDPTTLNRQGYDIGPQYRSIIFYHTEEQKKIAFEQKNLIDQSKIYPSKIVTEIEPFKEFFQAEEYHQNYYNRNRSQSYCVSVIDPKIQKLEKLFKSKLK